MTSGLQRIFTLSLSFPVSGIYSLDTAQRWVGLFLGLYFSTTVAH